MAIGEAEYRQETNLLAPDKPNTRTIETPDADGVITQTFEKEVYVYKETLVKTGPEVLAVNRGVSS